MTRKITKTQLVKKIDEILVSQQKPYEKKVALFNLVKNLDVGYQKPESEKRIDYLLEGQIYGEIARKCMEDYKKITAESFSKSE
jgi:hypothetical protein